MPIWKFDIWNILHFKSWTINVLHDPMYIESVVLNSFILYWNNFFYNHEMYVIYGNKTHATTVETPYNTNVGVQKIPDRAIWKPVVAKRNNTNPWSCSEPKILVTRDSRRVHMAEQPASRDRLE